MKKSSAMKRIASVSFLVALGALSGCGKTQTPETQVYPQEESDGASTLSLSASVVSVAAGGAVQFTASGGTGFYTYELVYGGGTLNSSTGAYVAPAYAATVKVRVTDTAAATATAIVVVTAADGTSGGGDSGAAALALTAAKTSIEASETLQMKASGGTAPYTYKLDYGLGTLSAAGLFTPTARVAGSVQIRVTDAAGVSATLAVTVTYGGTKLCASASECQGVMGFSREIDGRYYSTAYLNALAACSTKGFYSLVSNKTTTHAISCRGNYELMSWTGVGGFQKVGYDLCGSGAATVVSEIVCK